MLKKDFRTILLGRHSDEYTKVELISGDKCVDTYLHNFYMFMRELARMENGMRHIPIYTVDEDKMTFWMTCNTFYNSGIIRITFGNKGTLIFTQTTNKLILRIEQGENK